MNDWIHTRVERASETWALQMLAYEVFRSLKWQRSDIGLMRGLLLPDRGRLELRIHVWDKRLVRGRSGAGNYHDHPFDMRSTVLLGSIQHEEIELQPCNDGPYCLWRFPKATDRNPGMKKLSGRCRMLSRKGTIDEGSRYTFPGGLYHRAFPAIHPTVTLVERFYPERGMDQRLVAPFDSDGKQLFAPFNVSDAKECSVAELVVNDAWRGLRAATFADSVSFSEPTQYASPDDKARRTETP